MTAPGSLHRRTGLLLTLHRVRGGRVTAHPSGAFTDHDNPFPGVLVAFLRELIDRGQVRLDPPDSDGPRTAVLTPAGDALLTRLSQSIVDGK